MTTHYKKKSEETTWCNVLGSLVDTSSRWGKVNCRDCIMAEAIEKTRKKR